MSSCKAGRKDSAVKVNLPGAKTMLEAYLRGDPRGGKLGPMANLMVLELQTAKEILVEVFHARPGEVEEMIKSRLAERSRPEEREERRKRGLLLFGSLS
jgi:hypothetical protein